MFFEVKSKKISLHKTEIFDYGNRNFRLRIPEFSATPKPESSVTGTGIIGFLKPEFSATETGKLPGRSRKNTGAKLESYNKKHQDTNANETHTCSFLFARSSDILTSTHEFRCRTSISLTDILTSTHQFRCRTSISVVVIKLSSSCNQKAGLKVPLARHFCRCMRKASAVKYHCMWTLIMYNYAHG